MMLTPNAVPCWLTRGQPFPTQGPSSIVMESPTEKKKLNTSKVMRLQYNTRALDTASIPALHINNSGSLLVTHTASPASTRIIPDNVRSGWCTFSPSHNAVAAVNTSDSALHTGTAVDISAEQMIVGRRRGKDKYIYIFVFFGEETKQSTQGWNIRCTEDGIFARPRSNRRAVRGAAPQGFRCCAHHA